MSLLLTERVTITTVLLCCSTRETIRILYYRCVRDQRGFEKFEEMKGEFCSRDCQWCIPDVARMETRWNEDRMFRLRGWSLLPDESEALRTFLNEVSDSQVERFSDLSIDKSRILDELIALVYFRETRSNIFVDIMKQCIVKIETFLSERFKQQREYSNQFYSSALSLSLSLISPPPFRPPTRSIASLPCTFTTLRVSQRCI